MMALAGVPAFYYNSLLATPNYHEGVEKTQHNRTINRRKWALADVNARLDDSQHDAHQIFQALRTLMSIRRSCSAFSPEADQVCRVVDPRVFAVERFQSKGGARVLCLFNLSMESVSLEFSRLQLPAGAECDDLISENQFSLESTQLHLEPYQILWLRIR